MIRVSIAVMACPDRGVLLLRTKRDGPLYPAGTWEAPGGKVEVVHGEEESAIHTLARKVSEETGLELGRNAAAAPWRRDPNVWCIDMAIDDLILHYHLVTVPPDFTPTLSDEHDGWAWWNPTTVQCTSLKMAFPADTPEDRTAIIQSLACIAPPDLSFIWAGWRVLGRK